MYKYVKFFKPFGVLSQFTDNEGRRTLKEYIPVAGIYPAGRLDYRSEGLILLTDDGPLIQKLLHPRFEHNRTYFAQVEGLITPQAVEYLCKTIVLPGIQTKLPYAEVIHDPDLLPRSEPVRDYHPTSWLKIVLKEGKKHQVRRMTAAVGFPTLRLVRNAIGEVSLDELKPGSWRYLKPPEIQNLKSM